MLFLVISREGCRAQTLMDLPPQNPHFVGRENLFQGINHIFKKTPHVTLTGTPGFGKSQIAKHYAYKKSQNYHIVWWFEASPTLLHQFEKFAASLNLILSPSERIPVARLTPEMLAHMVKHIILRKRLKCLFVFDNACQPKEIIPYIFTSSENLVHTLVTTRKKGDPQFSMQVGTFTRKESLTFLRAWFPSEPLEILDAFAAYLDDHPLALSTAVHFLIAHPTVSIARYKASHDLRTQEGGSLLLMDQHQHTLYITLKIAREALVQEHPEASQVLAFLTLLHPQHVPLTYVFDFLKRRGKEDQLDNILGVLYTQSLIDVSKDTNSENARLWMHDLTHQLLYNQLPDAEKKKYLAEALEVVSPFFRGRSDLFVKRILQEPEHLVQVQRLISEAEKMYVQSGPLLSLKIRALDVVLCGLRDFEAAKKLLESILADSKKLGKNALSELSIEDQALLETNWGFLESVYTPNYENAIQHANAALSLLEQLPKAYEEKIRVFANRAQSYILLGELIQGESLIKKGAPLLKQSESPAYNALFIYVWSLLLMKQGKLQEVIQVIDQNEPLFWKGIENYPTIGMYFLLQKVEALVKLGKREVCQSILQRAEKMIRDFFHEKESSLFANLYVIKSMARGTHFREISQAISWLQEALQIYTKVFHNEKKHQMQGLAYLILGECYEQIGETQKARNAYLSSEAVYDTVLKEKAIDDVSRLYTAMALLGLKTEAPTMAKLYTRQQIEVFGYDHPRTREIISEADKRKVVVLE